MVFERVHVNRCCQQIIFVTYGIEQFLRIETSVDYRKKRCIRTPKNPFIIHPEMCIVFLTSLAHYFNIIELIGTFVG
jgi:hypothetical protein